MVAFAELRTGRVRDEQRGELAVDGRARDAARRAGRGRGRSVAHDAGNRLLLAHGNGQAHHTGGRARLRGCADAAAFYYKDVSEEGLYRYFSEVVQRVGDVRLKIYLYHIPPVAVVGITRGLVERLLAAYPNAIAGMKDSSGDWNNTRMFLDAFVRAGQAVRDRYETISKSQTSSSKSQGRSKIQHPKGERALDVRRSGDVDADGSFDVFVGSESFLLTNMRNGGAGTISGTANINPAAICKLYIAATGEVEDPPSSGSGRTTARPDLEGLQSRLNVVRAVFSNREFPSMIAALKQAIAIYTDDPAWAKVRPPLVELTSEQAKTLTAELSVIGFRWRKIKEK